MNLENGLYCVGLALILVAGVQWYHFVLAAIWINGGVAVHLLDDVMMFQVFIDGAVVLHCN